MPGTPAWLAAIESLLNRGIEQSLSARAAALRLNGTSLELRVAGLAPIRIAAFSGRLALASASGAGADAVIAGSPFALLDLFARRAQSSAPRGSERVLITGDAEIAARYRELLELARPDWEEELSRHIGDVPARRISVAARAALSWARGFARTARANLAEYLEEESRDLVSRPEVEEFLGEVDVLRETADRVEARIARLERHFGSGRSPEGPA
jgi:ubiquinone biosynthesis protein UbiJ